MNEIFSITMQVIAVAAMLVAIGGMIATFPLSKQDRRIAKLERDRKEKWLREDLLKEDLLLKKLQDGFTHSSMTYKTDGTGPQPEKKAIHRDRHWLKVIPRK